MIKSLQTNITEYLKSSFLKHIFIVASGTALAQAVSVLASPVISRLFTPENFGGLAIYATLASVLIAISALGYEGAIVLPKENKDAANILGLSIAISLALCIVIAALILATQNVLPGLIDISLADMPYYYLLPLLVLTVSIASSFVYWNNRLTKFKTSSYYRVSQSFAVAALSILFGWFGLFTNGLIVSFLIGNSIMSLIFIFFAAKSFHIEQYEISRSNMITQAKRFVEFPKVYLIVNFFEAMRENILVFMIGSMFSLKILGAYAFALRIVRVPLSLISASVSQVTYQKISQLKNENKDVRPFLYQLIFLLSVLSLLIGLVFVVFGPQLFEFVFGEQWKVTGLYARLLTIWFCCTFVSSPLSTVPLVFGEPKFSFYYTLAYNILSVLVFYICAKLTDDFEWSLFVTSLASGLYLIFLIIQIVRLAARKNDNHS